MFPFPEVLISRSTSVIICVVLWMLSTFVGCLSVLDQLKTASQWEDSVSQILIYSQFCKISINLQLAKQGLFSLIPEAVIYMNFAMNIARFFRTPILYNMIFVNHIRVQFNRSWFTGFVFAQLNPLLSWAFSRQDKR